MKMENWEAKQSKAEDGNWLKELLLDLGNSIGRLSCPVNPSHPNPTDRRVLKGYGPITRELKANIRRSNFAVIVALH